MCQNAIWEHDYWENFIPSLILSTYHSFQTYSPFICIRCFIQSALSKSRNEPDSEQKALIFFYEFKINDESRRLLTTASISFCDICKYFLSFNLPSIIRDLQYYRRTVIKVMWEKEFFLYGWGPGTVSSILVMIWKVVVFESAYCEAWKAKLVRDNKQLLVLSWSKRKRDINNHSIIFIWVLGGTLKNLFSCDEYLATEGLQWS